MAALRGLVFFLLLVQAQAVNTFDEDAVDVQDAGVDDQLSALFDDADLGEGAGPQRGTEVTTLADTEPEPATGKTSHKHVSFKFKGQKKVSLGESHAAPDGTPGPMNTAREMIQLGSLLESLSGKHQSQRTGAVSQLQEALQTKLLMDELKPSDGSFAQKKQGLRDELGEGSEKAEKLGTFGGMLRSKKNDMVAITKYLLERKKEGRPLSSHEDDDLQKFYYNRASTILKKIVLLKRGDDPTPENNFSEEAHEINQKPSAQEKRAALEVRLARAHAQAVVERLNFDAKVATANAAFNKHMLEAKERRMKAAKEERKQAEKQQLKAAKEKLAYDQQVADSEEKYNQALSTELLQRKHVAEVRVQKAAQQKRAADVAAAQATKAANEADKEAKEAELEAEEATRHAEELEQKQQQKQKGTKDATKSQTPVHIPMSVIPHANLASLLRYLHTALDRHQAITPAEQQLMQGFFLKRGSALLSQLAQVDPDATWHSDGVMREEQYEMDRNHPDQLSREWGTKNLKGDTVVTDFVHDALWADKSGGKLARPGAQQMVGLFGSNHEVPLKFDADNSARETSEPDLGESLDDDVDDVQRAYPNAMSTMLGVGEEEEA